MRFTDWKCTVGRGRFGWLWHLVWCLACGPTLAHDTWFEVRKSADPPALWFGTGERFPAMESRVEFGYLQRHACARHSELASRGAAAGRPLVPHGGPAGRLPQALSLRLPSAVLDASAPVAHSCWATTVPFDLELDSAKVDLYLKEIAASPALRAAWAAEQAAGRTWRERYVKHARVEIGGVSARPVGLPLEAVLQHDTGLKVRDEVRLQLLHEGRPLPDHPVELVSELSKLGIWRRTDADGKLALPLPLAGVWMLRSTLLRPPQRPGEPWTSDFVTLAFEVASAAR